MIEKTKHRAFTMAEILLSLTIIGIVAAITLPSLTGNINERTWDTQRKALYARLSQAIDLMPSLNGYGIGATESETAEKAAQAFITDGLAKVLKINNICDYQHITDCGFSSKISTFDGAKKVIPNTLLSWNENMNFNSVSETWHYSVINTNAVAFETVNNESIVVYYNPLCRPAYLEIFAGSMMHLQGQMCVNFVYDLNGKKGPNSVGKDIGFMTAINPTNINLVSIMFAGKASSNTRDFALLNKTCQNFKTGTRAPNINEAAVIAYNKNLIYNNFESRVFWTTQKIDNGTVRSVSPWILSVANVGIPATYDLDLYCIKN